jgi:hypothetical protein
MGSGSEERWVETALPVFLPRDIELPSSDVTILPGLAAVPLDAFLVDKCSKISVAEPSLLHDLNLLLPGMEKSYGHCTSRTFYRRNEL